MKFTKEKLELQEGLKREWLITNGIGGFSSSTIIGANTRRYHGLLIAPLKPPAQRSLILSKLDESITINNKEIPLYTNVCKNYITQGYKYQICFEKEYIPTFEYKVENINIKKSICMEYGKNTVCVFYEIKNLNEEIKLKLAPIVNFRDFHSMSTNKKFSLKQENVKKNKIKISIENNSFYINCSEGKYTKYEDDTFNNMFYIEEEKRGFYPEENHSVSGIYEIEIKPNENKKITFVCSLEENIDKIDGEKIIEKEISRLDKIIKDTKLINKNEENKLLKEFIIATDNFIVYRPEFKLHTIIAGYPWF